MRGEVLWRRFEAVVTAYHANHGKDDRRLIEVVNELAVAKMLVRIDPALQLARIEYEPDFLPDGRRIDFVVDRGRDNLYVEVKHECVPRRRRRTRPTRNSSDGRDFTRRTSNSSSIRRRWAVPSMAMPSPPALTSANTRWRSRSASPQLRRSGQVPAFLSFAATNRVAQIEPGGLGGFLSPWAPSRGRSLRAHGEGLHREESKSSSSEM